MTYCEAYFFSVDVIHVGSPRRAELGHVLTRLFLRNNNHMMKEEAALKK